jgi:two-component SAPR family response regulator
VSAPKVLIVEDEGLVALTMEDLLTDLGCEIVASFGAVAPAVVWLTEGPPVDGALLDVNLGGEMVYPVADLLTKRGVPFVFATGYGVVPDDRFAAIPLAPKPVSEAKLAEVVKLFGL